MSARDHGSASTYIRYDCRCQPCRDGNAAKHIDWRRRANTYPAELIPHGTRGGYDDYGCRCEACKSVKSAANAEYAKRRRAKRT